MYKVMVVDDEPIFNLAIKSICSWDENDIDIAYEAENGKQALSILENNDDIDIIITDLNMPIMDGIDLIKNIKSKGLDQRLVVLSGYEDYDLVRKAFKLGIEDYVLKTEMDENNLLELLKNIIQDMEKSSIERENRSTEEIKLLRQSILKNLIENNSTLDIEKSIIENNIKLGESNIVSFFLWIDDYNKIENRFDSSEVKRFVTLVKNTIRSIIDKETNSEVIVLSSQEYVVLYSDLNNDIKYLKNKIDIIIKDIKQALFNYINITVTVGVSDIQHGYNNVGKAYKESERNVRFRFLLGKDKIIYNSDISDIEIRGYNSILKKSDKFSSALKEGEAGKIMTELDEILRLIEDGKYSELAQMNIYYSEIVFIIINSIKEFNGESEEVLDEDKNLYEKINEFETYEEINKWIREIVSKFIYYKENNKGPKYSCTISRSLKYINENYNDPSLSIKVLSSYVELSENYFSVLFSNEVGESFKDYIINLRVNKAKELIGNTNMKIYEICEEVGYRNVEHFSRIFKKVTGFSPNSFKKN